MGRYAFHVFAANDDLSAIGLIKSGDEPHGRGLAAAAGTDHGEKFAAIDYKIHVFDGGHASEGAGAADQFYVFFWHGRFLPQLLGVGEAECPVHWRRRQIGSRNEEIID